MKYILRICFALMLIGFGYGYFEKSFNDNPLFGDRLIGLSVLFSVFVFMPLFLYHRWKDKDIKDYVLDKEKLEEMRNKNQ